MTAITQEELKRRGWHDASFNTHTLQLLTDDHDYDVLAAVGDLPFLSVGGRLYHMMHLTTIEQLEDLYRLLTGKEPPAGEVTAERPGAS